MIPLLVTLFLVIAIWYLLRTAFAAHPRHVQGVIDLLFLVVLVLIVLRYAGLL